jgi:hypothetical protein
VVGSKDGEEILEERLRKAKFGKNKDEALSNDE